ncbi:MAG: RluA family pseudouridine synthase [Halothiobacillus sp.]
MNTHKPQDHTLVHAVRRVIVDAHYAGQRVDNFLLRELGATHGEVPRSFIYRILRTGEVRVNSGRVKPTTRLVAGDEIRIPPIKLQVASVHGSPDAISPAWLARAPDLIVYEDDSILAVNKPAGLAVHGGSNIPFGLIELMRQYTELGERLELAHRIDRDTSGLVVLAKTRAALQSLQMQFRPEGHATKTYLAIVHGHWPKHLSRVDDPLQKWQGEGEAHRVEVDPNGKMAITHFSILAANQHASLLQARLETGRTHQIRVHAAHVGYPIVGDDKYGQRELDKRLLPQTARRPPLLLHAYRLAIMHPQTNEPLSLSAPIPTTWRPITQLLNLTLPNGTNL